MKFYIKYEKERQCYSVHDLRNSSPIHITPIIMHISESMMDRYLTGLLIMNGVIDEPKN